MCKKIEIFKDSRFGEIRTAVDENGNIMFALKDVCDALGIANNRNVMRYMDECYVHSMDVSTPIVSQGKDTGMSKEVQMTFVGEPNLYRCIFQSRKKIAKDFQKWVFDEVLPSIRKNGGYLVATEEDDENTIVERALNLAQKAIQRLKEQNIQLSERNDYLSKIFQSKDLYTATDIAQKYGMSTIKFNKLLNDLGIQYKRNGQWLLYADKANLGLADVKTYVIGTEDNPRLTKSLQWTAKGLEYIFNLLNEKDIHLTSQVS